MTLQSIAFKMLGSMADAEDAVHDAFVKWLTIDISKVENIKAYLVRMVTNSCLNIIHARNRRQDWRGEELYDVEDQEAEKTLAHFDLESQLGEAWLFLHRKLEPLERAIYVLRELFDVDYADLQVTFDRKAANCRKIFSRAKEKLNRAEIPNLPISLPQLQLFESFKTACLKGHLTPLIHDFNAELTKEKK